MATYYNVSFYFPTHVGWLTFATPTGMPDVTSDRDYAKRFATREDAFAAACAYVDSPSGVSVPFMVKGVRA